jgi:hypothetical protein
MEKEYFFSYEDWAVSSGFDYSIRLQKLSTYEVALKYYDREVKNDAEIVDLRPIILTNNKNLYLQYRHVLNENDFYLFCCNKLYGYNGINREDYGRATFQHFLNLKIGKYNFSYQYRKFDVWNERETGNSYEYLDDEGWKTSDQINDGQYFL